VNNKLDWVTQGATTAEIARILCVARAAAVAPSPVALVAAWYEIGQPAARRAVLRALPLLSHGKLHILVAQRAARSNDPVVFEAIAYDNPYPAAFFNDDQFAELVQAVVDRGGGLGRIIGLVDRERVRLSFARSSGRTETRVTTDASSSVLADPETAS
jgi:hypothetical protein